MRLLGRFSFAAVVFPFLACATQASDLYKPVFGGEASLDSVLLAPPVLLPRSGSPAFALSLDNLNPSLPVVAAFSATLPSPAVQLPEEDLMDEAAAIPMLRGDESDSPSARFILLILVAMMMIRFAGPFRDVISDICYTLLAIEQEGR